MSTSAPQWPGQDDTADEAPDGLQAKAEPGRPTLVPRPPATAPSASHPDPRTRADGTPATGAGDTEARGRSVLRVVPGTRRPLRAVPHSAAIPGGGPTANPTPDPWKVSAGDPAADPAADPATDPAADPKAPVRLAAGPVPSSTPTTPAERRGTDGRTSGRRARLVAVREPTERHLAAARRQARARLPSPVGLSRGIALALLEVEAGCRSAAQLERVFSPELWRALEHRIGRRGGPLPSGRSLLSVHCQEDAPGLADIVALVQRGDRVLPVALRLDAGSGRWTVTELRWWRNETDTATTPARDGGPA